VKQPIEVTVLALLVLAAGGIFWRQAHAPPTTPLHAKQQAEKHATADPSCVYKCQSAAVELGCSRGDRCAELCAKLATATVCKPQVERFILCFVNEPNRGWRCDEDGTPVLGHSCEPEQNAVADCMMRNNRKL
jgi:hypothetical protein